MSVSTPASELQRLTPKQESIVRKHLEELTKSRAFAGSKRAQDLLRLIVEHALAGEIDSLRERMIGAEMFHRPVDYDTANDSVVRVSATELRKKLTQAYLEGKFKIRIEVPPGSYVPRFLFQAPEPAAGIETSVAPISEPRQAKPEENFAPADLLKSSFVTSAPLPIFTRFINLRSVAAFVGAILLAVLILGWIRARHRFADARSEIRSVAVLPFENLSGDPKQDYFADGMTDQLIADLGQVSALHVISRTSVMSFKGTHKELPEIARELSVDGVVEGSVLRDGSQVHVTARLIDAKTDRPIWGENFTRNFTGLLASEGELAQSIASELSLTVTPQTQAHLARSASVNMEAEDLYLQGMLKFHSGNCENAIDYFEQAIKVDPKFASAYAALANCYGVLGGGGWMPYAEAFSNQKSDAARAIELDDSLCEGHAELADALVNVNWDWSGAEKEFQQALTLNPNSSKAHEQYGDYLDLVGKPGAAIDEARIAVTLDPLSGRALSDLAYIYYFSHQYDQALSLLKQAESKDPDLHPDIFAFGDVYAEKGMYSEAINEFLKLGDNPHALGHLGNALARDGQAAMARGIIVELENRVQKDGQGAYEIALVYTGSGQKEEAFTWLNKALENHDWGMRFLKVDPTLDPLRSDPRFAQLMSRVGLKP